MITNIKMSGVIFSHNISDKSPYYVINYDDISGLTDTVTSGYGNSSNKSLSILRNKTNCLRSKRFIKIIKSIKELEKKLNSNNLDIEFAMDKKDNFYLFQVRQLVSKSYLEKKTEKKFKNQIKILNSNLRRIFKGKSNLGKKTIFGQMPDWNPVEMIGQNPTTLAYSLYNKLITEKNWLLARKKMGYYSFKNSNLMYNFCGKPYIDIRKSLNSFLPFEINNKLRKKIVNHSINRLIKNPNLHDKIEFEIIPTCFSFDFIKRNKKILDILNEKELISLKKAYLKMFFYTNLNNHEGSLNYNLSKIYKLKRLQLKKYYFLNSKITDISQILHDCEINGIIPFSIIARHAFIAKELLNSLERLKILSKKRINNFENSLKTITSIFLDDLNKIKTSKQNYNYFFKKYGHLRPGTYDILSLRYDNNRANLFSKNFVVNRKKRKTKNFSISKIEEKKINNLLRKENIRFNAKSLLNYMSSAIEGREYAKFIFSKNISVILEKIKRYSIKNKIKIGGISNLDINIILNKKKLRLEFIKKMTERERNKYLINSLIKLPQLLIDETNAFIVPFQVSMPNFVTNDTVISDTVFLDGTKKIRNIKNKIILIENADPGFDWIFSHKIKGLITKYGGANSHMTIRCAELDIPAAIGCGEQSFSSIVNSNKLELNCKSKIVRVIN